MADLVVAGHESFLTDIGWHWNLLSASGFHPAAVAVTLMDCFQLYQPATAIAM